ncbi:hypothetical protein QE372_001506 [Agrobacterium pusense]|nr:hypothetical protein [Agrobacterium pusense]
MSRSDGSHFKSDAKNVAVQRDFYRIPELSDADIDVVKKFIALHPSHLHEQAFDWLNMYAAPALLRKAIRHSGNEISAHQEEQIQQLEIIAEESVHSALEEDALPLLAGLVSGQRDPWVAEDDAMIFSLFLAFQHVRTKRMRDTVLNNAKAEHLGSFTRVYPVMRAILASNLGWSWYSDRKNWGIRRLTAGGKLEFITSDQPTWNMLEPTGSNALSIYYPVSPRAAILFENLNNDSVLPPNDQLTDAEVAGLNRIVADKSHEQIFGSDIEYLKSLR